MVVSSYQAVSGAGAAGPKELFGEVEALAKGESYEPKVFAYQIAYNVIPQIGGEQFAGYTSEEMKLQNEGRRIMHLPRAEGQLHLCARACRAQPQRFHLPENQRKKSPSSVRARSSQPLPA